MMKTLPDRIKHRVWPLLLTAGLVSACVPVPKQQGLWPWEYDKHDTTDHVAIRAGVATFGDAPRPVTPLAPEALDARPTPAPSPTTTTEPASHMDSGPGEVGRAGKSYDFTVRENNSTADLLDTIHSSRNIVAFNRGNAPVSVVIDADAEASRNISSDKPLPQYAVVPPTTDCGLVRFSAKLGKGTADVHYSYSWMIGDYTATHRSPGNYRFPFAGAVAAFASVPDPKRASPYTRHAVIFSFPKGTPVLASRGGVVVRIVPKDKIDILHDDSTIATYSHLEKVADTVSIGKAVSAGDLVGTAGAAEAGTEAYMQLTVWRPEPTGSDFLKKTGSSAGFVPVSFELAFCVSGPGTCRVLTKSQEVSGFRAPAPDKKTKRKQS